MTPNLSYQVCATVECRDQMSGQSNERDTSSPPRARHLSVCYSDSAAMRLLCRLPRKRSAKSVVRPPAAATPQFQQEVKVFILKIHNLDCGNRGYAGAVRRRVRP
eukprot:5842061-Pleurochrysis_carterae.AAC.1